MKHTIIVLVCAFFSLNSFSQILDPVKWTTAVKKTSDTEAVLTATANIDANWHLYSQNVPEGGPVATTFTFEGNSNYLKKGNTSEDEGHVIDDPIFNMKIKYFANKAIFKQRIKLKTQQTFSVKSTVTFMVCDDSRCLPPTEVDLEFEIK
jgi:thiol:disulfide interchange protein DsbD